MSGGGGGGSGSGGAADIFGDFAAAPTGATAPQGGASGTGGDPFGSFGDDFFGPGVAMGGASAGGAGGGVGGGAGTNDVFGFGGASGSSADAKVMENGRERERTGEREGGGY